MSRINPGSAGASHVSRARPAAEPKVDRSPPRAEAREVASSPKQFRDEFVPSPTRGGSTKSPVAETRTALAAQRQEGTTPGEVVKGVLDAIRGVVDRILGGGNNGPVVQSPGKDQLVQGPGSGGGTTAV